MMMMLARYVAIVNETNTKNVSQCKKFYNNCSAKLHVKVEKANEMNK